MIEEFNRNAYGAGREGDVRLSGLLTYRTWKSQLTLQVLDLKNWRKFGTKYASRRTVALL
jgi:hypothetical protein